MSHFVKSVSCYDQLQTPAYKSHALQYNRHYNVPSLIVRCLTSSTRVQQCSIYLDTAASYQYWPINTNYSVIITSLKIFGT